MADTFDNWTTDPASVSPLAAAICEGWPRATASGAAIQPGTPSERSMRAIVDAVETLNGRVAALEAG
ncbi:hypothetical protein [Mycobacterium sp. MUNTM1]